MSNSDYRPDEELLVETGADKNEALHHQTPCSPVPAAETSGSRVKVIHELVQSGRYHVPATALAEKMIERLVSRKRRPSL